MLDPRLAGLTDAEKEALRAIYRHRPLSEAAKSLGLSDSGLKHRLTAAVHRAGVRRWDLVLLLGQAEGWATGQQDPAPGQDGPVPNQPLPAEPPVGLTSPSSASDTIVRLSEIPPVFDHGVPLAPPVPFSWLMRNRADRCDLGLGRRVAAILIWSLIGLVVLSLVVATMLAVGLLATALHDRGIPYV